MDTVQTAFNCLIRHFFLFVQDEITVMKGKQT